MTMHGGFRYDSSLDALAAEEPAKGRHGTHRQSGGDPSGEGDFIDMFSFVQVQQPSQAARLGRGYAGWIGVGFKRIHSLGPAAGVSYDGESRYHVRDAQPMV